MRMMVLALPVLALGGCALLGGEHYVMSYGVEGGTGANSGVVFSATISGR